MFKLKIRKSVLQYMNLFAHELGLLVLGLNILNQNLKSKIISGGV